MPYLGKGPFIDLTQAPYDVTQPWQGNDAAVPDYTAAIQQAADDARNQGWGLMDTGGTDGGRLILPPFVVPISDTLMLHDGVSLEGHSKASSRISMRSSFPSTTPGKHMINLGAGDPHVRGHASFGGQIKNLFISAGIGMPAAAGNFVFYSRNAQDTGAILDTVVLDGGTHYGGGKYMEGDGGASLIKFKDLEIRARKDAIALGNVAFVVKVSGSTMVEFDGLEPACSWLDNEHPELGAVANSFGLMCLGGDFTIKRVHGEACKYPIYFGEYAGHGVPGDPDYSPGTDSNCFASVERVTGGGGNDRLVWEDSSKWHDKIMLERVDPKSPSIPYAFYSSTRSVLNKTKIVDRIRV